MKSCFTTLLVVVLVAVLLGVAGYATLSWREAAARNAWKHEAGGNSLVERFPAAAANATALRLERLAATIGIDLVPLRVTRRSHPTSAAAARCKRINDNLRTQIGLAADAESDESLPHPTPEVATFLAEERGTLEIMAVELASGSAPQWERDLASNQGFDAVMLNAAGVIALHRLFMAEAVEADRRRDRAGTGRWLDAGWTLVASTLDEPYLLLQLVGQVLLRSELVVVVHTCGAGAPWRLRLAQLDLRSKILLALDLEAFTSMQASMLDEPLGAKENNFHGFAGVLTRWGLRDHAARLHRVVEDLRHVDVADYDPDADEQRRLASLPRWQLVTRAQLPDELDAVARTVRSDLIVQLTLLALEERDDRGHSTSWQSKPASIAGRTWQRHAESGQVTIEIDRDLLHHSSRDRPLRVVVHAARCR